MRFFAAAGLVMVLTGLAAFYAIGELSVFSIANLIGGPLLLLGAAGVEARRFQGFSGSRSRRTVLTWIGISTLVLLAVIGVNVLAASWTAALDLTVQRQYTLSDQTHALCSELEAEIARPALELLLFEDALLADDVRLLISAYSAGCPIVARELKTADAPPEAALILESFDTTVVACQSDRCEYVGYPSEENITNAILRLVRQEPPVMYFTVGHGEADLASERDHGFTSLTEALRNEGIELRAFVSVSHPEVPQDAAVVIAAAPARNFLQTELDAIDRYLARGGRLLVLQEPGAQTNLTDLLGRWGFELPDAIAVDRQSSPLLDDPQPISLVVNSFSPNHPITAKMGARTMVLMPSSRPVLPRYKPEPQDRIEGIVYSSRRAWAESDVAGALAGREVTVDPGELAGRELPLAAAGLYPRGDAEARIVVIGDRDFATNRWLRALYNLDLITNALLWLAEDEARVAIRPKVWTPDTQPLPLETTLAYFYSLAFALPQALLLLGIYAWYRQQS